MILERRVVRMLQTNCYLLCDEQTRHAVVIDPGGDAARIIGRLQQLDVTLAAILITHGHFDHALDAWTLKDALGGLIFLHPKDNPLLMDHTAGLGAAFAASACSSQGKDVLFVGDTLFAGSIGRPDFPGGSYAQLIQSVKDKIFSMNDATRVLPGHGPETTVGREKRTNPFF